LKSAIVSYRIVSVTKITGNIAIDTKRGCWFS